MTRRRAYTRSKGDVTDEDNVDPVVGMNVGPPTVVVTRRAMYAIAMSRSSTVVMGVILVMWEVMRGEIRLHNEISKAGCKIYVWTGIRKEK